MKKLVLIFFSIITISVNAQSHLVGIQGGLNMTNITADEIFIDEKFRFGCLFGLNYEFINS